jgi:hypothetical protein
LNLLIQERSRSVKAIFAMQRRTPDDITKDSGGFHTATGGVLQQYQFRIGGRYFPAAPVQVGGLASTNGGAEAYVELSKALHIVGDYRLSTGVNTTRWGLPLDTTAASMQLQEADFTKTINSYSSTGVPDCTYTLGTVRNVGSGTFAMAVNLETSSGVEISGLNAEEQSDIALIAQYSSAQAAGFAIDVYTYYDAMIVLRENNVLELIQ